MPGKSDKRVWLAAGLLPFKAYAVLAALWLVVWHSRLPANRMRGWRLGFFDYEWAIASGDFAYAAHFVVLGYFVAAVVLVLGGGIQFLTGSRKAGCISAGAGGVALIVGLLLKPYEHADQFLIL